MTNSLHQFSTSVCPIPFKQPWLPVITSAIGWQLSWCIFSYRTELKSRRMRRIKRQLKQQISSTEKVPLNGKAGHILSSKVSVNFALNNSGSLWLAVQYILASSVILWGKNSFSIRRKWHFDLRTKLFCMPYPYFNPECNKLNQFEPLFKKWNELKSWICTLYIFQSK